MKHRKFEFWPYTVVECREAEKHINEMRMDGYELIGINKNPSFAGYKEIDDAAKKKNYSVVINNVEDFAEDNNLIYMDKVEGMSVYCNEEKTHKYDKEEAFINLKNNILIKNKDLGKNPWLDYIVGLVLIWLIYTLITKGSFNENPIQLFASIINVLAGFSLIEKNRRAKRSIPILEGYTSIENFKDGKNGLYVKHLKTNSFVFVGVLLFFILISIYFEIINGNPGIGICSIVTITGVLTVLSATLFTLIKGDYASKKGVVIFGVALIFIGLVFCSPYWYNIDYAI